MLARPPPFRGFGASINPGAVHSYRVLAYAVADPDAVRRYRAKLRTVPGSGCVWWTGAVSGRGHGRFWLGTVGGRDVVVIAHRFAFALAYGPEALLTARVLGHRCDNPLCQLVGPGHVQPSSAVENRREWAARRRISGAPLRDRRGARGRARALRDALRAGAGDLAEVAGVGLREDGVQQPLWRDGPDGAPPW